MVSAERVLAYCKVPQEANLDSDSENKPPNDWPAKGNIEVGAVCVRRIIRLTAPPPPLPPIFIKTWFYLRHWHRSCISHYQPRFVFSENVP